MRKKWPDAGWLWNGTSREWWTGDGWSGVYLPPQQNPHEGATAEEKPDSAPLLGVADGPAGQYDVRRGAAGYAPLVSVFGSVAVAAIVILFSASATKDYPHGFLAVGLLLVGLLGSLAGSFGLAAIGAERVPTVNLAPAVMFIGVPVAISIASIFGAFEVLAADAKSPAVILFVAVVVLGGLFASLFLAGALADSTGLGSKNRSEAETENIDVWLLNDDHARTWFLRLFAAGVSIVLLSLIPRFFVQAPVQTTFTTCALLLSAAMVSFLAAAYGQVRTLHTGRWRRPIQRWEALLSMAITVAYFDALVIYLPR